MLYNLYFCAQNKINMTNREFQRRLRRQACPICGCEKVDVYSEDIYPEVYTRYSCAYCGTLLAEEDNSPLYNIYDDYIGRTRSKRKVLERVKLSFDGCNADVAGYLDCPKEYRRRVWSPPYWVSKGRWFREWAKRNMPSPRPYYISTPQPSCEPRVLDDDLPF